MAHHFDRYAAVIFLLIGIGFVLESRKIAESAYGSNVGPDIFPMALGVVLILLSIRLLIETKGKVKNSSKGNYDYKRFIVILIASILYGLLIEKVGYVITTFVFLVICFQAMQKGSWLKTILISAGFSFGVYFLYVNVLNGSLPGFPVWI